MHHRYFECNYAGFSASFMDVLFNTFQPHFKEKNIRSVKLRDDAKSNLSSPPTFEVVRYLALSSLCVGAWAVVANRSALTGIPVSQGLACALSLLCGAGPVAVACAITMQNKGV